jgi:hypothetical protein
MGDERQKARRKTMGEVMLEAGQRWVTEHSHGQFIAKHVNHERWIESSNGTGAYGADYLATYGTLLAPAPKSQQRWTAPIGADVEIVNRGGALAVEECDYGATLCHSNVVDVARWLADRDYRFVEVENACDAGNLEVASGSAPDVAPMASLAVAVAEAFAFPTRDDSRRYVDMAVKALRYEPFAKAVQATLISLVGDRVSVFPSANEIMATVDACHAWEHARGMIAPAKRTLRQAETRELTEIAKLAAWARVPMLDACDIGEIVAETYERARATC